MKEPPLSLQSLLAAVLVLWLIGSVGLLVHYDLPGGAGEFGDMFGAVNALFSGLAFAGVVYAIFLQRMDLALQRTELAKASGASLRQLHIQLQQMAINDPDLQEVWHYAELSTHKARKQHAYVNLVLSHRENNFATGTLSERQLRTTLGRYMANPVFRAFWERTQDFRSSMATGGDATAKQFHDIAQASYDAATPKVND